MAFDSFAERIVRAKCTQNSTAVNAEKRVIFDNYGQKLLISDSICGIIWYIGTIVAHFKGPEISQGGTERLLLQDHPGS